MSQRASLQLLREHGWDLARLVSAMVQRGTLLPEVRDQLRALDAPDIRALLRAHADDELLALVIGDKRSSYP